MLADEVETIYVEIWTSLNPAGTLTPQQMWDLVASPDVRVWEATEQWDVPMNLTFLNATSYKVRLTDIAPLVTSS